MTALVVFDVDGTLIDSQANIILAMSDAFERQRLTVPAAQAIRRIVGLSLVEAMEVLLPQADAGQHRALAEDYKTAFHRLRGAGMVDEPLYPGAREAVEALADAGMMLGVATGKSDRGLAKCLETHALGHHFITLQTADRHPSKPHPSMLQQAMADAGVDPQRTVMIGDTAYDMEMAMNASVRALGVAWGYHDPQELTAAGALQILDDFSQVVPAMVALRQ
jgi:phosphoglycolate phosphatase